MTIELADRRISWPTVIEEARRITESYDTRIMLRQLFYRLLSIELIPNTKSAYRYLSRLTAPMRRAGTFPQFIDVGRNIYRHQTWTSPKEILQAAYDSYRRDRTEGQPVSLYLGVEKTGFVEQMKSWFADLGIPIVNLHGYSSAELDIDLGADFLTRDRPNILLYAGDIDASGEDIERNIKKFVPFDEITRVALDLGQVRKYGLPRLPGKPKDPRYKKHAAKYLELYDPKLDGPYVEGFQVELDAVDPDELRRLFQVAIDEYWDLSEYEKVLRREKREKATLKPK